MLSALASEKYFSFTLFMVLGDDAALPTQHPRHPQLPHWRHVRRAPPASWLSGAPQRVTAVHHCLDTSLPYETSREQCGLKLGKLEPTLRDYTLRSCRWVKDKKGREEGGSTMFFCFEIEKERTCKRKNKCYTCYIRIRMWIRMLSECIYWIIQYN